MKKDELKAIFQNKKLKFITIDKYTFEDLHIVFDNNHVEGFSYDNKKLFEITYATFEEIVKELKFDVEE